MDKEKYKKTGMFVLSSGHITDTYYDMKEAMGEPHNLTEIVNEIKSKYNMSNFDVIIGIDYGGVPLAVGLSLDTGIPYAVLRKELKNHGTKKRIEGFQGKGRVILLDDVKTTGTSMNKAKEYLIEQGYSVMITHILIDRNG